MIPVVTIGVMFALSGVLSIQGVVVLPLCLFKYVSHLDCPGCGLIRSFISISHGNFWEAIRYNALGPVVYFYLMIYFLRSVMKLVSSKAPLPTLVMVKGKLSYSLFAVLFWGQWIFKLLKEV